MEARTVLQGEVLTGSKGWKYRTVLDKGKERMGKVSRMVVSEVENEISNRKPVRDDMQETRTVLQNIVDMT